MKTQVTIHNRGHNIIARELDGEVVASRSTTCNPAALAQLILDIELAGSQIDWDGSQVAKPATLSPLTIGPL